MNHSRGRFRVVLPSPAGSNPGDPAFNLLFWSLGSSPAMGESTGPRNCLGNSRSNGSTNSSASDLDLAFEWGRSYAAEATKKTWEILGIQIAGGDFFVNMVIPARNSCATTGGVHLTKFTRLRDFATRISLPPKSLHELHLKTIPFR